MVVNINRDNILERIGAFSRAPGSPGQAFYVVSHHGQGVIDAEQRIEPSSLQLALAG